MWRSWSGGQHSPVASILVVADKVSTRLGSHRHGACPKRQANEPKRRPVPHPSDDRAIYPTRQPEDTTQRCTNCGQIPAAPKRRTVVLSSPSLLLGGALFGLASPRQGPRPSFSPHREKPRRSVLGRLGAKGWGPLSAFVWLEGVSCTMSRAGSSFDRTWSKMENPTCSCTACRQSPSAARASTTSVDIESQRFSSSCPASSSAHIVACQIRSAGF